MENIILGLLLLQPRTIYQLRKRINDGLNLMYSCSTGSIQAAIKKLLKSGYIRVDETSENGKLKKIYSITEDGKSSFGAWVNSPIDDNTSKNPELTKIYFMGFSDEENRQRIIEKHIDDLQVMYNKLEEICKLGKQLSAELKENNTLFYQWQTAKYGRDLMLFNIEWYRSLLKIIGGK